MDTTLNGVYAATKYIIFGPRGTFRFGPLDPVDPPGKCDR